MKKVGFVGWRGMVGSVLMHRMQEEDGFKAIHSTFFSSSAAHSPAPEVAGEQEKELQATSDIGKLQEMDFILTCQGSDFTQQAHSALRASDWKGVWIDAASHLRMQEDSCIVLDPLNKDQILRHYACGKLDFIGGNCTASIMMLGIGRLLQQGLVDWISSMSYQAASGGGAKHMRELLQQMRILGNGVADGLDDPASAILDIDAKVTHLMHSADLPCEHFGVPLAGSIVPWIDADLGNGQSKEEWKSQAEANKILGLQEGSLQFVPIDGLCVRIGSMRSHAMALTMQLKQEVPVDELEAMLAESHKWIEVVPNTKQASMQKLSPAYTSGSFTIAVGRIRKLGVGKNIYSALVCGDQLLWGAAEPLMRSLGILLEA